MKRKLKSLITLITGFAVAICLVGCGEDKTASKALNGMFEALNEGDYYKAVSTYIYNNENSNDFLRCGENFNENDYLAYNMQNKLFKSLKYKIVKTDIVNQSEIHFTVKVTSTDLSPVGKELATTAAAYNSFALNAEEDEKITENEFNDIMSQQLASISKQYLESENVKSVTNEIVITMGYSESGKWLVSMTDDLYNVLTGGVYDTFYKAIEEQNTSTGK